jgi:hypothetical protein
MEDFELYGTTWPLRISKCKFPGELDLQLHTDGAHGIRVVPAELFEDARARIDELEEQIAATELLP